MIAVEQIINSPSGGSKLRVNPDYYILNDNYGDRILDLIDKEAKGESQIHVFIDHVVPSDCPETDAKQVKLRNFARNKPVYFREAQGVSYSLLIEEKLKPGQVVVGSGIHVSCCGALGCIPISVGEKELAEAINSGELELEIPAVKIVKLTDNLNSGVDVRSLAMEIQRMQISTDHVLVFVLGDGTQIEISERVTLCGALGDAGYPMVMFLPDDKTYMFLAQRGRSVEPVILEYQEDMELSLSTIVQQIRVPQNNQIIPLSQVKPTEIKAVFIGGCMGGSETDIYKAASFMKGKTIAKYLRVLVVPNTQQVYLTAVNEGWIDILQDAGVIVMNPHCSACWGKAQGHLLDDEAAVTTGFQNCPGCLGAHNAQVYITSLVTALECAVTGKLEASI